MNELKEISNLLSSRTLKKVTKCQKEAYKYSLCAIFHQIIVGRHLTKSQEQNIAIAIQILKLDRKHTNFEKLLMDIKQILYKTWDEHDYIKPYDKLVDKIIPFFRQRILELEENNSSLFQAQEISGVVDIKRFFGHDAISSYHWIEFSLQSHLIVTVPEMIIFNDLKVIWNYYIEETQKLRDIKQNIQDRKDVLTFKKLYRENVYIKTTLYRNLIVNSVSFVESYLYNLFFCIKESQLYIKNDSVKHFLELNKIEDETIMKKIVFQLFPSIKEKVEDLFKEYKQVSKLRNRYIHASAFIDASSNISELQPLINLDEDKLIEYLQLSIDIVRQIDTMLPTNFKMLFWWYDGEVNFKEMKKLNITNREAIITKINYH